MRAERDILVEASINNPWVTTLYYSFQDKDFLYLVMEYVPGGDLMSKLVEKDIFSVSETRAYIAELLYAIDTIHQMNYIHRYFSLSSSSTSSPSFVLISLKFLQ